MADLGHPTAGVALDADQIAAIRALATRDFEPETKTTMVTCLDSRETPVGTGYRAVRCADGRDEYLIPLRSDAVADSALDGALPVLIDGDTKRQVGAVRLDQAGRAIAKFSRSENGTEARRRFASGEAALSIAFLNQKAGRRAAALSLRSVSDGKPAEGGTMSDHQEIARLGAKHGKHDLATKAIAAGQSLEQFRSDLFTAIESKPLGDLATPAVARTPDGYSITKAIRGQMTGKLTGMEAEVHDELSAKMPTAARGVVVPSLLLETRATMTTSNVANLVGSMPRGDLFIDALQPASAVMAAGATTIAGLEKAVTIPKETGELTAAFVAEGSAATETSLTFGSVTLTPRRISGTASFTLESLIQSDPAIDQLIRQSLTRQIAKAIDNAALNGNGTAPNPTGILATSGINTYATAGSSTMLYAEALAALSKLEEDDVSSQDAVFLIHPTDYAIIASSTIDAGSGQFTVAENGRIVGRRVIQSSLVPQGTVALGAFQNCLVGLFGGTDLVVDNVTEARSAKVLITQHQMADIGVRYPEAFCDVTLTA
ncbi:MAG: phage major capsid protein [Roseicyclus sp.]|jgi:hypothetical protein|nr:phage major capsid protein [Roseicyclus sp.]